MRSQGGRKRISVDPHRMTRLWQLSSSECCIIQNAEHEQPYILQHISENVNTSEQYDRAQMRKLFVGGGDSRQKARIVYTAKCVGRTFSRNFFPNENCLIWLVCGSIKVELYGK